MGNLASVGSQPRVTFVLALHLLRDLDEVAIAIRITLAKNGPRVHSLGASAAFIRKHEDIATCQSEEWEKVRSNLI
jgi:hypothetical protein